VPFNQLGIPFARDSHTSWKAAESVATSRKTKGSRYLRLLAERGPQTDHEAASALVLPLQSINSIRNGLMMASLVERGTEERASPYGKACSTWQLTAAGRAAVQAMQETAA